MAQDEQDKKGYDQKACASAVQAFDQALISNKGLFAFSVAKYNEHWDQDTKNGTVSDHTPLMDALRDEINKLADDNAGAVGGACDLSNLETDALKLHFGFAGAVLAGPTGDPGIDYTSHSLSNEYEPPMMKARARAAGYDK